MNIAAELRNAVMDNFTIDKRLVSDAADAIEMLGEENGKLRELISDMWRCISHANEQDWFYFEKDKAGCGMSCTVNGEGCGLLTFAYQMRELGIEVEE